jgi:hypothetical protein
MTIGDPFQTRGLKIDLFGDSQGVMYLRTSDPRPAHLDLKPAVASVRRRRSLEMRMRRRPRQASRLDPDWNERRHLGRLLRHLPSPGRQHPVSPRHLGYVYPYGQNIQTAGVTGSYPTRP